MGQMTVTPVSTQGCHLDGKFVEEGDPLEIRAPYDGRACLDNRILKKQYGTLRGEPAKLLGRRQT